MSAYPKLSSKDVEKILRKNGFEFVSQKGSHRHFKGIVKGRKRRVTVLANRKSFHPKTLKSMIRQSGLTEEEFFKDIK
ncbi:MAG: type II toxin-antitoxin system HicA family toxin [Methanosarcinales archaeon]